MADMDKNKLLSHSFSLLKVFKNRNFNHFECSKRERTFSVEELFVLSSMDKLGYLFCLHIVKVHF